MFWFDIWMYLPIKLNTNHVKTP